MHADLSLCLLHMPHCWKSYVAAHICFGCSKQNDSFEYPQHVFWLRNKLAGDGKPLQILNLSLAFDHSHGEGGCGVPNVSLLISANTEQFGPVVKELA